MSSLFILTYFRLTIVDADFKPDLDLYWANFLAFQDTRKISIFVIAPQITQFESSLITFEIAVATN